MVDPWEPLLTWKLSGPRYEQEHGFDLRDAESLVDLRDALLALARAAWREENPDKDPPNDAIDMRIRAFGKGSCAAEVLSEPVRPAELFASRPKALHAYARVAATTLHDVLAALSAGYPPSQKMPTAVVAAIEQLVKSIPSDVTASVALPDDVRDDRLSEWVATPASGFLGTFGEPAARPKFDAPAMIDNQVRELLPRALEARTAVEVCTLSGEVAMASLKGRAHLSVEGVRVVRLTFGPAHEEEITRALHQHRRVRLRVRGKGRLDPRTGAVRELEVSELRIEPRADPDALGETTFQRWAVDDPDRLLRYLRSRKSEPTLLTFAAEIAGSSLPRETVVGTLLRLLRHAHAAVREGAVYGLRPHRTERKVATALRDTAATDESPGVRDAAREALED